MGGQEDIQGEDFVSCYLSDTTWWVVFEDKRGRTTRWWDMFTSKGFRHCWTYTRSPTGCGWFAVDALSGGTQVKYFADKNLKARGYLSLTDYLRDAGAVVIPCDSFIGKDTLPRAALYTCVESVRHILGIECPFIYTPLQLYRYLVKHRLNMFQYNEDTISLQRRKSWATSQ